MLIPRIGVGMLWVGLMVLGTGVVLGQVYPNKPIRIITSEAGAGNDLRARLIAQAISGPLGQQVVVENRPSGMIPGEIVSKAPPDGYTLLVYNNILWIGPLIQNAPYDAVKDFAPITLIGTSPNVLVVHPSLPVKSVKELIALAKASPGELNYASTATGSGNHLSAELFKSMAGVNIVRINYKGGGPLMIDLISGQVQLAFPTATTARPHVKSGRLLAVAVTSREPSALVPGLPTVAASGLPSYESVEIKAVLAPARTPAAIISRLNQEIVRVLNMPEVKERLFNAGVQPMSSSPDELAATMKSDMARLGKVIKDAGIKAN